MRRGRRAERGAALLTVMIVVVVLTVIVAGALTFTGQEASSASKHMARERIAACTIAARNFVLSQLRPGAAGKQQNPKIQGSINTGDFIIRTGHLDQPAGSTGQANSVTTCGTATSTSGNGTSGGGATMEITNLANKRTGGGGSASATTDFATQCLTVIASCEDLQNGATSEVEFQVRLGF